MPQKVGFRWKCRLAHFTLFCDAWHQHGCRGGLGVCSYYRTLYDKYHNRNLLSCALMSCGNTATLSSLLSFECVHTLTQVARWSGGRMSNVVFLRWGNVGPTLPDGQITNVVYWRWGNVGPTLVKAYAKSIAFHSILLKLCFAYILRLSDDKIIIKIVIKYFDQMLVTNVVRTLSQRSIEIYFKTFLNHRIPRI